MSHHEPEPTAGTYVRSLERGLAVIRAFDAEHPELTLAQVAERTGMSRASARRFLHTLAHLGYVQVEGRAFRLGPQVLSLGYAYLSGQTLKQVAEVPLRELSARLGESVSLSVLDGAEIVYLARVAAQRIMAVDISVGTRLPAVTTSMGRVLLAGRSPQEVDRHLGEHPPRALNRHTLTDPQAVAQRIEQVRRDGWALVDQELEVGLRSLAVGVRGAGGEVVAGLNVSTRVGTEHAEPRRLLGPTLEALRDCAGRIEEQLRLGEHRV